MAVNISSSYKNSLCGTKEGVRLEREAETQISKFLITDEFGPLRLPVSIHIIFSQQ